MLYLSRYAGLVALAAFVSGCGAARAPASLAQDDTARPALTSELADVGPLRERLAAPDDADWVLLYGGEQRGSMDVCGCVKRPRGSLARVQGYRDASHKAHPGVPDLLVNAGYWLDDTIGLDNALRADVQVSNAWMVEGLQRSHWDALNITFRELPWLAEHGSIPEAAVSANIRATQDDVPALPTHRLLQIGEWTVGITGVSGEGMTFIQPESYTYLDPVEALQDVLPTLREQADIVVVLAYELGGQTTPLARELEGVDILVEAGGYANRFEPFWEPGTVWVRSHTQTMRLGELRLKMAPEDQRLGGSPFVGALDRKIDLDGAIPEDAAIADTASEARSAIEAVQEVLFGNL